MGLFPSTDSRIVYRPDLPLMLIKSKINSLASCCVDFQGTVCMYFLLGAPVGKIQLAFTLLESMSALRLQYYLFERFLVAFSLHISFNQLLCL